MIFYFTGTGNALWLAERVGAAFGENPRAIADELKKHDGECCYSIAQDEKLVFVFPVHSWGPAPIVTEFISRLVLDGYSSQQVYALCVCGDNCGLSREIMASALKRRGIILTACYSLQMPNNFILMKGFGVDSDEVRDAKLATAPERADRIIAFMQGGVGVADGDSGQPVYVQGSFPFLKSRVVYPLFKKYMVGAKKTKFHVTDSCIGCGLCAKICPVGTITMQDGRPQWGSGCQQCTACIHRCPVRAIEYGDITQSQGRYHHPSMPSCKF